MKNLVLKIKNTIFKIFLELFIFDREKRSKIKARCTKKYLEKYVNQALDLPFEKKEEDEFIIWQYWHQGEDKAPGLVKRCLESVKKFEGDKKIVVLSFDTIKDYIELPSHYYDLVNSGKMKIALFSDIVRLYLLNKYGGMWIDATIYLTGKIPEKIIKSDFYAVQKDIKKDMQENKMYCYLIRAKSNSTNLSAIKNTLDIYWKSHDFDINYFIFEHISTLLSEKSPQLKEEWDNMPIYKNMKTGTLQKILFDEFDEKVWQNLIKQTPIHKLSYKKHTDNISKNSYYNYILNNEDFNK